MVHVNRKRFGAGSNSIYRLGRNRLRLRGHSKGQSIKAGKEQDDNCLEITDGLTSVC